MTIAGIQRASGRTSSASRDSGINRRAAGGVIPPTRSSCCPARREPAVPCAGGTVVAVRAAGRRGREAPDCRPVLNPIPCMKSSRSYRGTTGMRRRDRPLHERSADRMMDRAGADARRRGPWPRGAGPGTTPRKSLRAIPCGPEPKSSRIPGPGTTSAFRLRARAITWRTPPPGARRTVRPDRGPSRLLRAAGCRAARTL